MCVCVCVCVCVCGWVGVRERTYECNASDHNGCVCVCTSVHKLTLYRPIGRSGFSHLTEDLSPW